MKDFSKIYKFYDTDVEGLEDYDIAGEDYRTLIEICCKYCTTFSLIATNKNSELLEKLKIYEVEKNEKITHVFTHYGNGYIPVKYYKVSSALCQTILSNTKNIRSWINGWGLTNPEDPTFYREDGSVFFTSTIHEGECTLMIKDEDVSEIISDPRWNLLPEECLRDESLNTTLTRWYNTADGSV